MDKLNKSSMIPRGKCTIAISYMMSIYILSQEPRLQHKSLIYVCKSYLRL